MNTKPETPQIPELQLAKVGDRRRKKGGALPFSFRGSAGSARGGGGIWGSLSGMMGQSALKVGITLLVGVLGVGAYNVGKSLRPDESRYERKPAIFASKNDKSNYAGDMSGLPGRPSPVQNSVGMVSGSILSIPAHIPCRRSSMSQTRVKLI